MSVVSWVVRRPAFVALPLAALAVAVGVGRAATDDKPRLLASNRVPVPAFVHTVSGGKEICQVVPSVPAGAGSVRLLIASFGRATPALGVSVGDGAARRTGHRAAGWREGLVTIPLAGPRRDAVDASLCLHNLGAVPVTIGGAGGAMRVDFMTRGERSLAGSPGWLADRFAQGKPSWIDGPWTLYVAVALAVAAAAGGVAVAARGILR